MNSLEEYKNNRIAVYGLGTETQRLLPELKGQYDIVGLLDGYRTEGEIYGLSILSIEGAISAGICMILVVARPGSCKAIAKRIGDICRDNDIALFDIRGKDLLQQEEISYSLNGRTGGTKSDLLRMISKVDTISVDLFDTLVTRKVLSYTDVFDIVDSVLKERGICIPGFSNLRIAAEKALSINAAPNLDSIYENVLQNAKVGDSVTARELAELEWKTDLSVMFPRRDMCDVINDAIQRGKKVVVVTDTYYHREQIEHVLRNIAGISDQADLLVSCEIGTPKTQQLFDELLKKEGVKRILHIGDDETSDMEPARRRGFETFRIYNGADLLDALGGMGLEQNAYGLSDRVRIGMAVSHLFNSPFWFETEDRRIKVCSAADAGYLFCAPLISDFVFWLKENIREQDIEQVLFGARDGYLVKNLYERIDSEPESIYFLTSRIAAIRGGVRDQDDLEYVDSMKLSGSRENAIKARFGIDAEGLSDVKCREAIFAKSTVCRRNYLRYAAGTGISDKRTGFFDFVAKGTTQYYLDRILDMHSYGFYFLQLEPEFMADKGLDITSFYTMEEKDFSAIFDSYYILETILTSPEPQVMEFDEKGMPVWAEETRTDENIQCVMEVQEGIKEYFDDYLRIVPESERKCNKKLDEVFLTLINNIVIDDERFGRLKVEDPFFGRMTDIKDVLY